MKKKEFIDQMGERVIIPFPPVRIISLVPSLTELLYDFGLRDRIAGVTRFCVHPREHPKNVRRIGGTKKFNFESIETINPDLIIGNKEENYKDGIAVLKKRYPVWMSDISNFDSALGMIAGLGAVTDCENQGIEMADQIKRAFEKIIVRQKLRVLYLIWKNPWMAAGKGTFIDSILGKMGLQNCVSDVRYPEMSEQSLAALSPDLVLLSSEPYPFKNDNIHEMNRILPSAKVLLADGEMFSWYGSRMKLAPEYFNTLKF